MPTDGGAGARNTVYLPKLNINDAYTLPKVDGTVNQVMKTDGAKVVTWEDESGGGGNVNTSGTPVLNDFAKFVNGTDIEGRSFSETRSDLNVEDGADVTDTANVTAAGALMDSEVDADIKTLVLPANTTISAFGASLIDDAAASNARTTLGLVIGTDVLAEQTIGIADNNLVEIDSASVANGEYAKFTANGLESKTFAEVKSDLAIVAADVSDFDTEVANNVFGDSNALITNDGIYISDDSLDTNNLMFKAGLSTDGNNASLLAIHRVSSIATSLIIRGINIVNSSHILKFGLGNTTNTALNGGSYLKFKGNTSIDYVGSFAFLLADGESAVFDANSLRTTFKTRNGFNGDIEFFPDGTGGARFQSETDSTDFFQVLDTNGGTPILNVDTANERVGVSIAAPTAKLHVVGDADTEQLLIQSNATQTDDVAQIGDVSAGNYTSIQDDGDIKFMGTAGLPFGSLYLHDGAQNIDISAVGQGVYVKITGLATGELNNVTINSDAFNVGAIGHYLIQWQVSGDSQGNNTDYEVDIFVNGVEQTDGSARHEFATLASLGSMSGTAIIDITNTGHDIDLRMKEIGAGAGTDFDIFNVNFNLVHIGGT